MSDNKRYVAKIPEIPIRLDIDIYKKYMDAREEMNRPITEYFYEKLMEELKDE